MFILLLSVFSTPAQTQLGNTIFGNQFYDFLGTSVDISANGKRIILGAPQKSNNVVGNGYVSVFEWNGSSWEKLGQNISGQITNENFGTAVAISGNGNTIAVGAPVDNGGIIEEEGTVRIFDWNGSNWEQVEEIHGDSGGDRFGTSVDLSYDGNIVAGGGTQDSGYMETGYAKVYQRQGDAWIALGQDIEGIVGDLWFGTTLALSADGSRFIVGAPFSNGDDNIDWAGKASVFDWDGNTWNQVGESISGTQSNALDSYSLAISADKKTIAVGSGVYNNNGNIEAGQVRVFEWEGTQWTQIGETIQGSDAYERLGSAVALSGDGSFLAIGSTKTNNNFMPIGDVKLFSRIDDHWEQVFTTIEGESNGDRFGYALSISEDGNTLVISGSGDFNTGITKVYHFLPVSIASPQELPHITIYPNPSTGPVYFSGIENGAVQVFDHLGRHLVSGSLDSGMFDLSDLGGGFYYLILTSGKDSFRGEVIKY